MRSNKLSRAYLPGFLLIICVVAGGPAAYAQVLKSCETRPPVFSAPRPPVMQPSLGILSTYREQPVLVIDRRSSRPLVERRTSAFQGVVVAPVQVRVRPPLIESVSPRIDLSPRIEPLRGVDVVPYVDRLVSTERPRNDAYSYTTRRPGVIEVPNTFDLSSSRPISVGIYAEPTVIGNSLFANTTVAVGSLVLEPSTTQEDVPAPQAKRRPSLSSKAIAKAYAAQGAKSIYRY